MAPIILWLQRIIDIFFPPRCLQCKKYGIVFCEECFTKVPITPKIDTTILGIPLFSLALYRKKSIIAKAIHTAKYQHTPKIFKQFGECISKNIPAEWKNTPSIVISTPLHFLRQQLRGYNQSEYITQALIKNIPHWQAVKGLQRKKNTTQQAHLKRKDRIYNVRNAFIINNTMNIMSKNTPIVLVDDVISTGSTIKEMIQCLHKAGFFDIKAIVIAKAE